MTEREMTEEVAAVGRALGMPPEALGKHCQSMRDGDCVWRHCPQNRDGEPRRSGRHCPLDIHQDERGYQ